MVHKGVVPALTREKDVQEVFLEMTFEVYVGRWILCLLLSDCPENLKLALLGRWGWDSEEVCCTFARSAI